MMLCRLIPLGSHIDRDLSASATSSATDHAAGIAAAAAARLTEARAKASTRHRKSPAAPSRPDESAGSAVEREALREVREKITDLQGQHPGDAARYLAALPAAIKWRCFLGVSPAQRAAIMLEMSADERKLALSMLRPGERTIAERFLGIRNEPVAQSPAASMSSGNHYPPLGSLNSMSDASVLTPILAAPSADAFSSSGPTAEAQVVSVGISTVVPQVEADFVRDKRQVLRGGSGGISLEERLFSTFSPPSLHTTTASANRAVGLAVNSAAMNAGHAHNLYETNASALSIDPEPSTLQETVDSHACAPVEPSALQAALQRIGDLDVLMGRKMDASRDSAAGAGPEVAGQESEGYVAGGSAEADAEDTEKADGGESKGDSGPDDTLSKRISEMQRVVQETLALRTSQHGAAYTSDEVMNSDHELEGLTSAAVNKHITESHGEDTGKLSSLQKRSLTSLPPRRPIPVPKFRCALPHDLPLRAS